MEIEDNFQEGLIDLSNINEGFAYALKVNL